MQAILVTGGAGFIGSNFVRYLLNAEPNSHIVNLDALTYAGSLQNLKDLPNPSHYTFIQGDICDQALVKDILERFKVNTIIHFAAETHVDRSILGPQVFIQTNVMGTFNLLESARRYWLEEKAFPLEEVRFHHISTDEVYGTLGPNDPPFTESTPYAPNSPYSASKASSDHLVRAYSHTYGLPVSITNCSNNYGPYQFPEKMIPLMILNALHGKPLPVYGDGQQIRDWLYVEDHCEAIWEILQKGKPGETYNIGGNNQPPNVSIVEQICDLVDEMRPDPKLTPRRRLIQFVKDRPGHDRRYAMDITKVSREVGWQPRHSLTDGLLATVEWFLTHPEWVTAIHEGQDYQNWMDKNYTKREKTL